MQFEDIENAIRKNNNQEVERLLKTNKTIVNDVDGDGWTLLHYAAKYGNLEAAKLLVINGANCKSTTKDNNKPIHIAADNGHTKILEFFINDKKMDVNDKGQSNMTPLHYAAKKGELEIIEFLARKNAIIDAMAEGTYTPLHYASEECHYPVVEFLIGKGADISKKNREGKVPIQLAEEKGYKTIVELLRDKVLLEAVSRGDREKVEDWLTKGANIHYKDQNGWTVLHHASNRGIDDLEFIEFLVDKKTDINSRNADNDKPLHIAVKNGHENIVKYFLNKLNINDPGKDKRTPLHYAAAGNRLEVARYLIEGKNATIDAKDKDDCTALHHAAKEGHIRVAQFLVKKEANINSGKFDELEGILYNTTKNACPDFRQTQRFLDKVSKRVSDFANDSKTIKYINKKIVCDSNQPKSVLTSIEVESISSREKLAIA